MTPDAVRVDEALPPLHRTPTRLTVFMFGTAYWTSHRIHYDVEAARAEGFGDVLVTANLLSAYNVELLTRWTGDPHCVIELEERNVSPALAGDPLTISGTVVDLGASNGRSTARCSLLITNGDGDTVVRGSALVYMR
jgi:hydroxyacyl-ACP dehydratase HTD2-like protein with hotdog domain